jgi:hypothetical protein
MRYATWLTCAFCFALGSLAACSSDSNTAVVAVETPDAGSGKTDAADSGKPSSAPAASSALPRAPKGLPDELRSPQRLPDDLRPPKN